MKKNTIQFSGNHTSLTKTSRELLRALSRCEEVGRVSPGQIMSVRAKSQIVKIRREGALSMTVTTAGDGIQDLFVICRKSELAFDVVVSCVEGWAKKNNMIFRVYDQRRSL